jgi:hypothetical protein
VSSRRALLALGVIAVMVTACTNDPARQAEPTTSNGGHPTQALAGNPPTTPATYLRPVHCQAKLGSQGSGSSLNPDPRARLSSELVPPEPVMMTVCRYAGLNQKVRPGTLEASRVVEGSALSAFVGYLDQKSWQVIQKGVAINCPMSQGSTDLLDFVYSAGPDVMVSLAILGCPLASNGYLTVWAGPIGARVGAWVGTDAAP